MPITENTTIHRRVLLEYWQLDHGSGGETLPLFLTSSVYRCLNLKIPPEKMVSEAEREMGYEDPLLEAQAVLKLCDSDSTQKDERAAHWLRQLVYVLTEKTKQVK